MVWFSGLVYGKQKSQFSINGVKLLDFFGSCVKNGAFKAALTTKGRKTGKEHTVWLRAVSYDDKIYFSRRNEDSDWLKNSVVNPQVKVQIDDKVFAGVASLVADGFLAKKISELKYPGEERAQEVRIVIQVEIK
jgi:hypothetical protein